MKRLLGSSTDRVPLGTAGGLTVVAVAVVVGCGGSYQGLVITTGMGFAIVVLGMVLQLGYSNQLAFSQSIFMGFGAYGYSILQVRYNLGPLASVLITLVVITLAALVVGTVLTRAPGISLALATLLLPFVCYQLATGWSFLGKFQGVSGARSLWGSGTYTTGLVQSGVIVSALLGASAFIVLRILRSGTGLQLEAMGRNAELAEGIGVGVHRRALEVFVLASLLAGLGGVVAASLQGVATPSIVAQPAELTLLVMFFLGGRRSVIGAVIVAVAFEYLSVSVKFISVNLLIINGIVLLAILVAEPDGIGGLVGRLRPHLSGALSVTRRKGAATAKEDASAAHTDVQLTGLDDAAHAEPSTR